MTLSLVPSAGNQSPVQAHVEERYLPLLELTRGNALSKGDRLRLWQHGINHACDVQAIAQSCGGKDTTGVETSIGQESVCPYARARRGRSGPRWGPLTRRKKQQGECSEYSCMIQVAGIACCLHRGSSRHRGVYAIMTRWLDLVTVAAKSAPTVEPIHRCCSAYNEALIILGRQPVNRGLGDVDFDSSPPMYLGLPVGNTGHRRPSLIRPETMNKLRACEGLKQQQVCNDAIDRVLPGVKL